jgi:phospholipid-translocating ATPase
MVFKKLSVNGIIYGEGVTEAMVGAAKREGREIISMEDQAESLAASLKLMIDRMKRAFKNRYLQEDNLADRSSPHRQAIIDFFKALAICHGVIADKPDETKPFLVDYKAESPDGTSLSLFSQ